VKDSGLARSLDAGSDDEDSAEENDDDDDEDDDDDDRHHADDDDAMSEASYDEKFKELEEEVATLVADVHDLALYTKLNFTGFVKIVKVSYNWVGRVFVD
jgi:SPX domain protein involved in polyphosphate accumulation